MFLFSKNICLGFQKKHGFFTFEANSLQMDLKQLNKDLETIVLKKNELNALTYDHADYDDIEEELHDMEDDFLDVYGDALEEVLEGVHGKIDADNDILLPIAYIGSYYKPSGKNADGTHKFEVAEGQGVLVESSKVKGGDLRLIFLPNPLQLLLVQGKDKKIVVWGEEGQ